MNATEFKNMLSESVKYYCEEFAKSDFDTHPYDTWRNYGRYETAKNILGHFNDLLNENDIVPKKK